MKHSSFREILKSSVLTGGSSMISVVLATVRTKILAVLIGTEGVGLFGAYGSVTLLISGITGLGVSTSGIRQIAEAAGTGNQERVKRIVAVLRQTSLFLGLFGMFALLFFCRPISRATFGDASHANALALLSVTILFSAVAGGQTASIQGLRRVRDLAALTVWGAVMGTLCSIPIIIIFRKDGVVMFLVVISALSIASAWWYARKLKIPRISLPASAFWDEARLLLRMGFVFMATAMMVSAVGYITRVMVIRELGLGVAGLYQAATTLSGVYVGFILSGMGADFFPRLAAVAGDNREFNRLINEQTEAALLMAVPGLLVILTFAPWIVRGLYSAQFGPTVGILRWQLLGILGRVIVWPLIFALQSKGFARTLLWTELFSTLVHLGLNWLGIVWFGANGLGMAFFGLYIFYGLLLLFVLRRSVGFRWSRVNLRIGGAAFLLMACVFLVTSGWLSLLPGTVIGSLITGVVAWYAVRKLILRAGYTGVVDAATRLRNKLMLKAKACSR